MRNARRSNDKSACLCCLLLVANREASAATQHKIKFVGASMRVHRLHLIGFKTIQTNHHVFTLPKSSFVKLFRLRSFEVAPIQEVRHARQATIGTAKSLKVAVL